MEFNEVIKARRSIRKYKPDPIPDDFLDQLFEAARLAPSGLNIQPWRYVVVRDREIREKIAGVTPSAFVVEAPVIIVCCLDKKAMGSMPVRMAELVKVGAIQNSRTYASFLADRKMDETFIKINLFLNSAISIEHILLKAVDLGLGTCWIGAFDAPAVKEAAGIGDDYEISAMITVGYPDQNPAARPRLPVSDIVMKHI